MARPKLIVFGISHFCEKARWALDWHGITYSEISWAPGLHAVLLKRYGAKSTTLPVLLDGETLVQGSGAIIDWVDSKAQDRTRSLSPQTGDLGEAQEIERRADDVIGVHVRRLAYAELLPNYPSVAKRALLPTSGWHGRIGGLMWPATRRIMMRAYDIRPEAASESRSKLESELGWLDSKLSDRRSYLVGDRFSRVDVTVASLLAPFARPKERYPEKPVSNALAADVERWSDRPVMRWVNAQYRAHRLPLSERQASS
jgi:glutathione S-transferase